MITAIVIVFAATYVGIASRRLKLLPVGRPAIAMLGALGMVIIGALTPEESYAAVDGDTILLLFGMMLLAAYLKDVGLVDWLGDLVARRCRTALSLLAAISLLSGVLSAILLNDSVCLFLTPVVLAFCARFGLPIGPFLIAVATSANIGSAATIVGNPQNMLIGSVSGIPFLDFAAAAGPIAAVGLGLNTALLVLYYRKQLAGRVLDLERPPSPAPGSSKGSMRWVALAVLAAVIAAFLAGFHLGYTTLAGASVLMIAAREDPRKVFARVDWTLLVFFCGLFIVVAGLGKTGLVERAWAASAQYLVPDGALGYGAITAFLVGGSNLVSNVPMTLIAAPFVPALGLGDSGYVLLAFVTTVAGNLTLLGSVANIIVAEMARKEYDLGYVEYLKFGAVSTVLVLAAGVAVLALMA
ncbi:MAG: anion transporter [Proteobacteria bacterium]|jgi:Na+/H+ antiporter NhaD/arsenite permease-like protein|nr:anion transporter [Pseudomonadota bacterium]